MKKICSICNQPVESFKHPTSHKIFWFDKMDEFMCPDGETEHKP